MASCLAASVSSRLAARRTFASASADIRAVRRFASRSAAAWASRAESACVCASRRALRASRFGRDRGREFGFGGLDRVALRLGIAARVAELGIEIGEAVLRREAARRRGRRIRGGGEAVPAPQVAVRRDQPLAGLQLRGERRPDRAIDHADLRQPARHLGRRGDVARERLGAFGQRRIAGIGARTGPADRRGRIDRRFEIVAERSAERGLVALFHREQVDRRRPELLRLDVDQLGERFGFRLEPVHAPLGLGERAARHVEPLARRRMRGFGAQRRGFGRRDRALRRLDRAREREHVGRAVFGFLEACELALDFADLAFEPHQAAGMVGDRALELVAPRHEVGERAGQFGEGLLDLGKRRPGFADARRDRGLALRDAARILRQAGFFRAEPVECGLRVGLEPLLARDILRQLVEPAVELEDALVDARFLAVERLARHHQALQRRARGGFLVAQRRQRGGGHRLRGRGLGLRLRGVRDAADRQTFCFVRLRDLGVGGEVAQMEQRRLGLAHVGRHLAVLHRLARLTLQRVHLRRKLADHVFQPVEVRLGRLQPQLGLVAARMQAGDAGGFFQHAAALLGLGLDDLADAALMDERRRARAGRGVGEQQLHVARAHLAAVEAIERALLALDAARDFQRLVLVELRRRRAVGVVEEERHLGIVARRARVGAVEDDVVHAGGAQRLVRGLAHHPAQRLDQVRLAAAVRPDHAGQALLDLEVGRLDEGLEAEQP